MNKEFEKAYLKLIREQNQNLLNEGKFLNNVMAGLGGLAITGGGALGLNELSKTNIPPKPEQQIVQQAEQLSEPNKLKVQPITQPVLHSRPLPKNNVQQQNYGSAWVTEITIPFILQWEGKITDNNGMHVLYDDDVKVPTHKKRRWDGKGGQAGIDAFIKSCKGKPTIGYGTTDLNIVRRGKINNTEAKQQVLNRIKILYKHLYNTYPVFKKLNPNQKTALLSFTYNLGQYFIENNTEKMKKHLENGNLRNACYEMRDCDNITQNDVLIKVPGLTKRRQAEMKLFMTP